MNIGKTIASLRRKAGLSQQELSKMGGLTQTSLSQIETGATDHPNKETLDNICTVLGVPKYLIYLLSMEEEDVPESKRELYKVLFPAIRDFMLNLFNFNHQK